MMLRPSDIHVDAEKARLGVGLAAEALGVKCDCRLQTMWRVELEGGDLKAFIEIAKEAAINGTI